jgi:hypothetical protein
MHKVSSVGTRNAPHPLLTDELLHRVRVEDDPKAVLTPHRCIL